MRKFFLGATLALAVGGMAFASTPELELTSGTATTGILGPAAGAVSYTNIATCNSTVQTGCLGGWQVTLSLAASNSPALTPYGLDLHNLTAECFTGTCANLVVEASDVGYTTPSPTILRETFTGSLTGAAQASQNAWFSQTDSYFATGTSLGATPTETQATSPFAYANNTHLTLTGPFSLTMEETFAGCSSSNDCASYSTEGMIRTDVPEPASVALFGSLLLLFASRLRRRKITPDVN